MNQYIKSIKDFLSETTLEVIEVLRVLNPSADQSQVNSWKVLVDDIKKSNISRLPESTIISIEFQLPIDGMGIDFLIIGYDSDFHKHAFLIESKQWVESNISQYQFGETRSESQTLHPQIQLARHRMAFKDYTSIGEVYQVHPYLFMRNLTSSAIQALITKNPQTQTRNLPVSNDLERIIDEVSKLIVYGDIKLINDLKGIEFKPSKSIIAAMESIVTKYDPFILTSEQEIVINQIFNEFENGKKIIRITGAAGSGKTAILLHAYIKLLNKKSDNVRPIFISGAQNTKLYQSLFREVERSFTYSFSLDRMVGKTIGEKFYICMDEAQHNEKGIITRMIERGAHLILCYDERQSINANNPLEELNLLDSRDDFVSIELKGTVRFSGSQIFESNVKRFINGNLNFEKDDLFDFRVFDSVESLEKHTIEIIKSNPDSTVAVTGLLSNDASEIANRSSSRIFIEWGYQGECKWIPYVQNRNYLSNFNGKLWVGTWWLPGLDVDYVSVIIGGDARMSSEGLIVIPEGAKHYKMMISVSDKLRYPNNLYVYKNSFGKTVLDTVRTSKNVIEYAYADTYRKENFMREFTQLLRNNYYILLTRGRKGCFVCFANKQD